MLESPDRVLTSKVSSFSRCMFLVSVGLFLRSLPLPPWLPDPSTFALLAPATPASLLFSEHHRACDFCTGCLCREPLNSLPHLLLYCLATVFYLFDHCLSLLLECKLHTNWVCMWFNDTSIYWNVLSNAKDF